MIDNVFDKTKMSEIDTNKIHETINSEYDPDKRIDPEKAYNNSSAEELYDPDKRVDIGSEINDSSDKETHKTNEYVRNEEKEGGVDKEDNRENYEKTNEHSDIYKNCPVENGKWDGERGESKWMPDKDYIPQKENPDQKTWNEVLTNNNIDGISFENGEPDFSKIEKGDVKIDSFSLDRDDNFAQADKKLAELKGCKPGDVEKWRKENKYTWHECRDTKTLQKVPSIIHGNITHSGGISEAKRRSSND